MADFDLFIERLRRNWGADPVEPLCENILQYMEDQTPSKLAFLTFRDFAQITGRPTFDQELLRAITILVGTVDALDTKYMFIEPFDSEEVEVEDEDVESARRSGVFYHPLTGQPVENYEAKLFPFFTPSRAYLRARGVMDE